MLQACVEVGAEELLGIAAARWARDSDDKTFTMTVPKQCRTSRPHVNHVVFTWSLTLNRRVWPSVLWSEHVKSLSKAS